MTMSPSTETILYQLLGEDEFNRVVGGYYQQFATGGTAR